LKRYEGDSITFLESYISIPSNPMNPGVWPKYYFLYGLILLRHAISKTLVNRGLRAWSTPHIANIALFEKPTLCLRAILNWSAFFGGRIEGRQLHFLDQPFALKLTGHLHSTLPAVCIGFNHRNGSA
jgi:hypothetical protein